MRRLAGLLAGLLADRLAAAPAASAGAAPTLYTCTFESARGGRWMAPEMALAYEAGAERATVSDPIAQHSPGGPVQGRMVRGTAEALGVRGDPSRIRTDQRQFVAKLMRRLTIRKADGRAGVSVRPAGDADAVRAPGRCRPAG